MGLLLYQAPVESDINSKPASRKTVGPPRSSIRRHRLVRGYDVREQERERRRRAIAQAAMLDHARRRSPTVEASTGRASGENTNAAEDDDVDSSRIVLRDAAGRIRNLDERVVSLFGSQPRSSSQDTLEHLQRELHDLESRSRSRIDLRTTQWDQAPDRIDPTLLRQFERETGENDSDTVPDRLSSLLNPRLYISSSIPRERFTAHLEPYTLSEMRSTQDPNHPSRSATTASSVPAVPAAPLSTNSGSSLHRHIWDGLLNWRAPSTARTEGRGVSASASRLDGLGDRNRSLSPEGDNAWETLLTTLTPDPQPPSVGSSFATTSASAAATQSTVDASSATSFANLDTTAEDPSGLEPPCESGYDNDNSDMEEDEDDELPGFMLPSLRTRSTGGLGADDALDLVGGSEVIQHLVRSLARREDIPDEWWAQVGLSRTLSREDSSE
ncbi:hypothetical protein QBC35DRAFT_159948 [Podospora australis]|uniref:Uncharacterized protein n=1 Tax=Podospora australis TaxID=1536484 RepID=A0AAN7ALB5_9PEZI|nr:hypothetical protein QBC35DRAFT_159948 [Podospora australis]